MLCGCSNIQTLEFENQIMFKMLKFYTHSCPNVYFNIFMYVCIYVYRRFRCVQFTHKTVTSLRYLLLLLHKAEKLSVCLCHAANLVISAWISSEPGLCNSCVSRHKQVFFNLSVSALCWTHERLKGIAVAPFCL